MKFKILYILLILLSITSTNFSYAGKIGCSTTSEKVCTSTGKKDKEGKEIQVCHTVYNTNCTDKIVGTMYYTKDRKNNVYDMTGTKVGENGKINVNLDINAIEKSRLGVGEYDPRIDYRKKNVEKIELKTFKEAFDNSSEYDKSYGYKTDKSLTYDDYKKNFESKGLQDIRISNYNVENNGQVTATISGNFSKDGGLALRDYVDNEKALKEYLGKIPESLSKQLDVMSKEGTIERELVMIPYAVEIQTSYKRKQEIIPPAPSNPEKPKGAIIIDDVIGCPSYLTWSEIDHDKVETTKTYYTDSDGKEYTYNAVEWKPHTYKYRVDFKTEVEITDAKGRNLKTNTLKSGYGFRIKTKTTHKVTGGNGRNHSLNLDIKAPAFAYEQHDWNMTHIYKNQPKINYLKSIDGWSYKTAINKLSKTSSDVIYTDRDMPDGIHKIYVEIKNISVAGRHLCTKNMENIKIKGNMYEDYKIN